MTYTHITTDIQDAVAIITLNRPQALNALCAELMCEVDHALDVFENDDTIGCLVLTGSEKAFAAGADIKEMADKTYIQAYKENFITSSWDRIAHCRKPIIAAVSGYALGGGCEIAMMCDFIIAADTAKFGQPEITIGTIPGAGGTQRLTRAIGKAKAMDMCLTGRMMTAEDAERAGLVSRIVPSNDLMTEVLKVAKKISAFSKPATMMVKEAVNKAFESSLAEGLHFERRLFHATFGTPDQKEGMNAFIEKREAKFR